MSTFQANGRTYPPPPSPIAVICLDGCADEYLDTALARGTDAEPAAMARDGWRGIVRGALPSFTNVNNTSIVTGVAPAVHGICGNFFLNPETGEEVMMNSPGVPPLRHASSPPPADAGRKVAFITAKEKLRDRPGRRRGRARRHRLLVGEGRRSEEGNPRHRRAPRRRRQAAAGDLLAATPRSTCSKPAPTLAEPGAADFLYLSHDRLHAAQISARKRRRASSSTRRSTRDRSSPGRSAASSASPPTTA